MATYATPADVVAAFDGDLGPEQLTWIGDRLDAAEQLVGVVAGSLAARITAGTTTAARIRMVLVEMVLRVVRNPAGYRQEATGPYSYTLDSAVSSGRLHLTRDDRRLLGLAGAKATTISLSDPALEYLAESSHRCWPEPFLP